MQSKYYDSSSAIQVIGCVLSDTSLLDDTGEYVFSEDDFCNDFHKMIFGTIYDLITTGAEKLSIKIIEDYLKDKEKSYALYKKNNGAQWLKEVFSNADILNFKYYYNRLKKMTLLRTYESIGLDMSWVYDPDNIIDLNKKQKQSEELDAISINELADKIDNRVLRVRELVVDNDVDDSQQIGDGIDELLESLQENPLMGNPLFDPYFSHITLGARMGTFYIRSASTGTGKTRSMMADACYLACSEYYKNDVEGWVSLGQKCNVSFISVELDEAELQTMALSFISGINENKIIKNQLDSIERGKLSRAVRVLKDSGLYIEYFPNYSMKDIENCIKRNLRVHKANYIFFDYICSSMKIIEEITRASGGMRIREDQVLYLLSSKLKEIASTYHVFIMSATQTNANAKYEKILDQNVLAGAKSIANRVDVGSVMVDTTPEDMENLQPLLERFPQLGRPNLKLSIYKNRRGEYNRLILWMNADKGTCRYKTLFATDYDLNLININFDEKGDE